MVIRSARLGGAGEPPLRAFGEKVEGALTQLAVLRGIRDFIESAKHDDRRPVESVVDVIHFQTDVRILPHPLDLLAYGGKTEQACLSWVIRERYRHDVRLIHPAAGETGESRSRKDLRAVSGRKLVNDHRLAAECCLSITIG